MAPRAMFTLLVSVLVVAKVLPECFAFPGFVGTLPNIGATAQDGMSRVPSPAGTDATFCQSIGHAAQCFGPPSGGGNAFGQAWVALGASRTWANSSFCRADTDGDGLHNGYELGDPNCVWVPGATPARTVNITNPAFSCSTASNPFCLTLATSGSPAAGTPTGTPAVYTPSPTTYNMVTTSGQSQLVVSSMLVPITLLLWFF